MKTWQIVALVVVVLAVAYFGYKKFYAKPCGCGKHVEGEEEEGEEETTETETEEKPA